MFKLMILLKRKPGMSMEDFIDYYETKHARIGESVANGVAVKYIRRYLTPINDMISIKKEEPPFDCAMEMWFENEDKYKEMIKLSSTDEMIDLMIKDEEQFLDRTKRLFVSVNEYESELAG